MTATAATSGERAADSRALIDWLAAVAQRHDLNLAQPADGRAAAIATLLAALSREFAEYQDVAAGARDAARANAVELAGVVRSAGEQGALVRATASVASEARSGAASMADAAAALEGFAGAAADAAGDAGTNLAAIDAALRALQTRLSEGDGPLAEMRRSTGGVADFVLTLARLSRNAQLLAVNASIEAAHLAEAGSRFGIVADEVRKLSVSTRDSKADVGQIVSELRKSTELVAIATTESKDATTAAGCEITGAGEALSRTRSGIDAFKQTVARVADVAGTQSMALEAISSSVDQIAHHAAEAASASRDAAQFDLDALLERAQKKAARWTLHSGSPATAPDDTAFARWIAAIVGGCDAQARADIDADADLEPLVRAVRALLARVDAEQRDVLGDIVQAAVVVSRNGYAWRSIAQSLDGVSSEIVAVREMIGESVTGAHTSAELATEMRRLVDTIRSQYDSALQSLEGALARISRISASVREIDGFVESMSGASARADQIMSLIETLSSETDLLSLNAAIEAAHAGELGQGFGVIAEEIRMLARSTNASTLNVSELVSSITRISVDLQASIAGAAESMREVISSADGVRDAIAVLRASFESATERALEMSATAVEQSRALDRVLDTVNRSGQTADRDTIATTEKGRLELAKLGSRAHAIAARRPIGTVIERVRAFGETLCTSLEAVYESALESKRIAFDRFFDLSYHPIVGTEIESLARLFDVSRVPADGFSPVKYATSWDAAIDADLNDVLEAAYDAAAQFNPVTIFVSDLNGFFYAYPRRKIAGWTNDPATDNTNNRIKRMFEDEYALRVGRCGLGPNVEGLGQRTPYERFRANGCILERPAHRPWGGYVYARDTNSVCNEVVMALYVRGARHSTLRICYDPSFI